MSINTVSRAALTRTKYRKTNRFRAALGAFVLAAPLAVTSAAGGVVQARTITVPAASALHVRIRQLNVNGTIDTGHYASGTYRHYVISTCQLDGLNGGGCYNGGWQVWMNVTTYWYEDWETNGPTVTVTSVQPKYASKNLLSNISGPTCQPSTGEDYYGTYVSCKLSFYYGNGYVWQDLYFRPEGQESATWTSNCDVVNEKYCTMASTPSEY